MITWSVPIEIIPQVIYDASHVDAGQVRDATQVAAHVAVAVVVVPARPGYRVDRGNAPVPVGVDPDDVCASGIQLLQQRCVVGGHDQLSGDGGDHLVQQVQDQFVVDAAVELVHERHPAAAASQNAREQGDQLGHSPGFESIPYASDAPGDEPVEAQAVFQPPVGLRGLVGDTIQVGVDTGQEPLEGLAVCIEHAPVPGVYESMERVPLDRLSRIPSEARHR